MEEKYKIEGNRLIAEFMGADIVAATSEDLPRNQYGYPFRTFSDCEKFCEGINMRIDVHGENRQKYFPIHHLGEMKYHSSWEWLMPVVNKIESLQIRVAIDTKFIRIHTYGEQIEFNCEVFGGKMNALWYSIIEFIKSYNLKRTNKQ